ncbi:hypothetical protein UCRNP2_1241 [Neofusicoccum parvum UCRNP2]|uniref:Uncharacterized protein n=1 Tax=Botryosphaeria parva (strain UCR-NP2) TaxID=1287680 RepID=R1GUJ9_BOTPV|nr:hypothetical protein UCRNP2_1241 [Neofusicoccum parvum UCRNP2]
MPRGNRKRPQSQAGASAHLKKQKVVTFDEKEEDVVVEDVVVEDVVVEDDVVTGETPGNGLDQEPEKKAFYQKEPEYLDTYDHIKAKLIELFGRDAELDKGEKQDEVYQEGLVAEFAREYFDFTVSSKSEAKLLEHLCKMDVSSALLIGCVADGGPGVAKGWLKIFTDPFERRQLVSGIIGMVLNEHVFSSLCYGAMPAQLLKLHEEIDFKYRLYDPDSKENIPEDGFTRGERRYKAIREIISADSNPLRHLGLPPDFIARSKLLAWQLHTLLSPILSLAAKSRREDPTATIAALYAIAAKAGLLALQMRLDRGTVYHAHAAYKDEFWAEDEMRAFNRAQMVRANPARQDHGGDEARAREARAKLALVRYTLAPGWKAYKKGGWRKGDKERGVRVTDLTKAWVGLRWGWQRRWETVEEGRARAEKAKVEMAKAAKGKGREKGKAAAEEEEGFEEWLMIWAENRKDKSELRKIQGWFDFNEPAPEGLLESDDDDGAVAS